VEQMRAGCAFRRAVNIETTRFDDRQTARAMGRRWPKHWPIGALDGPPNS